MFIYSNTFSYSTNPDSGEYLLSFLQQHPIIDPAGKIQQFIAEPVADILLTRAGIEALKKLLNEIPLDS